MRVLTDLSGPYDTVVQELEFDSMEEFMQHSPRLFADPRFQEQSRQTRELMQGKMPASLDQVIDVLAQPRNLRHLVDMINMPGIVNIPDLL